MTAFLVGIDSGGTRTNVRIVQSEPQSETRFEIPGIVDSSRGWDHLSGTLHDLFARLTARTQGATVYCWISATGYAGSTCEWLDAQIEQHLDFDGLVGVANDGVTLALSRPPETVVVIAGTGSVVLVRSKDNRVAQFGGNGWVATDYGSAFWIGLRGIRAAFAAFEGRSSRDTFLRARVLEHYEGDPSQPRPSEDIALYRIVRSLARSLPDQKPRVASFARVVCDAAARGDSVSEDIVREAAGELAEATSRACFQLAARARDESVVSPARIVLCGSMAVRSDLYRQAFEERLCSLVNAEIALVSNGADDAVGLARRLQDGAELPDLDVLHPWQVFECTAGRRARRRVVRSETQALGQ